MVDASVLVYALGDDGVVGEAARDEIVNTQPIAPDFVDLEVMSGLRRQVLAGELDELRAKVAIHGLATLPLTRVSTEPLIKLIWSLRNNATPYDASYIALAAVFDLPFLTSDRRLANAPNLPCQTILFPR